MSTQGIAPVFPEPNLIPSNVKDAVSIYGVTGNLTGVDNSTIYPGSGIDIILSPIFGSSGGNSAIFTNMASYNRVYLNGNIIWYIGYLATGTSALLHHAIITKRNMLTGNVDIFYGTFNGSSGTGHLSSINKDGDVFHFIRGQLTPLYISFDTNTESFVQSVGVGGMGIINPTLDNRNFSPFSNGISVTPTAGTPSGSVYNTTSISYNGNTYESKSLLGGYGNNVSTTNFNAVSIQLVGTKF